MSVQEKKYVEHAYAKINLALDILGVRPNGYHELDMVMQQVSLCDTLTLKLLPEEFEVETAASGTETENPTLPGNVGGAGTSSVTEGRGNIYRMESCPNIYYRINREDLNDPEKDLSCRALKLLFEEFQIKSKVLLSVTKRIPVAAGLAGGSTDAAAALKLANRVFHLGLTNEQLQERGVKLGADVPYCILGAAARARGIGEILDSLPDVSGICILLVKPDYNVSTAWVYGEYDKKGAAKHPDVEQMISCIEQGQIARIPELLGNVLETVTIPEYPVIDKIKREMCQLGAANAMMSGSGPTVFGIYTNRSAAENAADHFRKEGYQEVFVTEPVRRTEA